MSETSTTTDAPVETDDESTRRRLASVRERISLRHHQTRGPTGAWGRRPLGRAAREVVQQVVMRPLIRYLLSSECAGQDLLPVGAPSVIFVANHASHADTPLLLLALPAAYRRRIAVAAAADYFFDTWWRAAASGLALNTFPVERHAGTVSDIPGTLLRSGWSLLVYPEGTRSPDGWMRRFRMGAAWLAVENGVPVVPVAIRGSFAAMARGTSWPRPGRPLVKLRFGPPLQPGPDETVRQFAPRVQQAVAELIDEESHTWWEARRRAAAGTTPSPIAPKGAADWRLRWAQVESPRRAAPRLQAWSRRRGPR